MTQTEQWVSMADAARAVGKSAATITRLVKTAGIQTKVDPTNNRVKLVNLVELQVLYSVRSKVISTPIGDVPV